MELIISLIIAYLLGSVNCAILVCKYLKIQDPRQQGSNNPGTTNVLRIAGKNAAIATLIGDALKGFIAILIGRILGVEGFDLGLVGIAVYLGHVYPVFFKFQGGKGVATLIGLLFGLHFALGVTGLIIWVIIAAVFRYSSLAALVMAALAPVIALLFHNSQYFIPLVVIAVILFYRHRDNIARLRSGKEDKMNFGKKDVISSVKNMAADAKKSFDAKKNFGPVDHKKHSHDDHDHKHCNHNHDPHDHDHKHGHDHHHKNQ